MSKGSTIKLAKEVFAAILSMRNEFTMDELIHKIDEDRKARGEKEGVSKQSVSRVLVELYLLLGVNRTPTGSWKKGESPIGGTISFQSDIVNRIIDDAKIETTAAEIGKWIEMGAQGPAHKAYICYPYRDNPLKRSMELLVLLTHLYPKAKDDFAPATPHEMYWRMEEKIDRKTAMEKCAELIGKCDFVLFCLRKGDAPTAGMKQDMEIAAKLGKEVRYIEDLLGYYPNVAEIMKKSGLSNSMTGEIAVCPELKLMR